MGAGYRRDERTRSDEFFDRYVGKVYGNDSEQTSRELLTMGLQSIVTRGSVTSPGRRSSERNPDPELEKLVVGMLATIPGKAL
jgi:hypothetical protein